jgi:hypothetical protein
MQIDGIRAVGGNLDFAAFNPGYGELPHGIAQ